MCSLLERAAQVHQRMGEYGRLLLEARSGLPGGSDAWQEAPEEVAGFAAEFAPEERDQDASLESQEAPQDGSGEEKPAQEAQTDQGTSEKVEEAEDAGICGHELSGGRLCRREPGHGGRHHPGRKPAGEAPPEEEPPPGEPPPDQAEPARTREPAKTTEPEPTAKKPDDRFNEDLEATLTGFQVEQTRRLLREQGKASAEAGKQFLTALLKREISKIADVTEADFRMLTQQLDPDLFEQLYQMEIF
jgi:hypothetical protein